MICMFSAIMLSKMGVDVNQISTILTRGVEEIAKGGASEAGSLVVKAALSPAVKWLKNRWSPHNQEVQQKAEKNVLHCLEDIADKIKKIEETSKDNPFTNALVTAAFKDPAFAATFQEALYAASKTSSEEKHKLLARVISERLISNEESLVSLVSPQAINAIANLSPNLLRYLALAVTVYAIRPSGLRKESLSTEQLNTVSRDWWVKHLSPIISKVSPLTQIELMHLVAMSCIGYESFIGRNLSGVLKEPFGEWETQKFIDETVEGQKLKAIWENSMQKLDLTSVGQMIGTIAHDEITGQRTSINWDIVSQ
jgi:hypothetical protein